MQDEKREADRLDAAIADAVAAALEGGAASKAIEKAVSECLISQVKDLFRWNGSARRALEEKLSDVIVPAIEGYDFGKYAVKLDRVLGEIAEASQLAEAKRSIEAFRGLVAGDEDERATFKALFAAYGKWVAESFDCTGRSVEDGEYLWIGVACDAVPGTRGYLASGYETFTVTFGLDESEDGDERERFARVVELYRWGGAHPLPSDGGWYVRDTWRPSIGDLSSLSEFDVLVMRLARHGASMGGEPQSMTDSIAPHAQPELEYV